MTKNVSALITLALVVAAMAFAQAAQDPKPAPTAAQVAAALANLTLDPAERDILLRLFSDGTFRKAQAVVPVLKPVQNGDVVRCTLEPLPADEAQKLGLSGAVNAYLDAKGDQVWASHFQTVSILSILRFSGTVTFPFTTRENPELFSGYAVRDEEGAKKGIRSTVLFQSVSLAQDTATFTGAPGDPLSFILLPEGLVYIHGSGTVVYHGSTTDFGTVRGSDKGAPPK